MVVVVVAVDGIQQTFLVSVTVAPQLVAVRSNRVVKLQQQVTGEVSNYVRCEIECTQLNHHTAASQIIVRSFEVKSPDILMCPQLFADVMQNFHQSK
jgi:hypothetical protein